MKSNRIRTVLALAAVAMAAVVVMVGSAQAAMIDTFTNQSALQWDTGNTASSKTVSFSGTNTGVSFDVTLATNLGNLIIGSYKPGGVSYLSDSGGINGSDWFEGILTITVDNLSGAAPGDITFQLLNVSGRELVTNAIVFTSTATATKDIPLGVSGGDKAFSNVGLDSSAANMAGGQYLATLAWKNLDPESSGLYRYLSFEVTAVPEPATLGLLALGGLAVIRRRKSA